MNDKPGAGGLWILEWDYEWGGHKGCIQVIEEWSDKGEGDGRESINGASHAGLDLHFQPCLQFN
jgi:hypothetical protein